MRYIFTLLTLTVSLFLNAQDGVLDNNWGTGSSGTVINQVSGVVTSTNRMRMIILPSKKILQTFTVSNGTNTDFGLARFNEDGSLDVTFGGSSTGYIVTDFGGDDYATCLALQSDGKIVVAGYKVSGGNGVFAVARYTTSGTLDGTFGTSGKTTTTVGTDASAFAIAIRSDDKIILGGTSGSGSPSLTYSFALAQYTSSGTLDASNFGSSGITITTIHGPDQINALGIQSTGKIVAGGFTNDGTDYDFALARYNTNGTLDNTPGNFGTNGIVTTDFGADKDDLIYDIKIHSSDDIIAGGVTDKGTIVTPNQDFAVAIYQPNGTLEPSFGTGGRATADFGLNEVGYDVDIQGDNKILLAGSKSSGFAATDNDFAVCRFLASGTLDPSFGPSATGESVVDFGGNDLCFSLAPGQGYLMLGGISDATGGGGLALARLVNATAPLPVRLTSFTASKQSGSVLLQWETQLEEDMLRYEIEKSSDGIEFKKIGSVNARGNSGTERYNFTDLQPQPSINFYRLKMISTHGSYDYSRIVSLKFDLKATIQAYPNPVTSVLNLQFTAPAGNVNIQVVDAMGRVMRSINASSTGVPVSISVDMSGLQQGIYFITVGHEMIKVMKE